MADRMFNTVDTPVYNNNAALKYKGYIGIGLLDEDEGKGTYKEGATASGIRGTRVPVMNLMGGIENSTSAFGLIKEGFEYKGDSDIPSAKLVLPDMVRNKTTNKEERVIEVKEEEVKNKKVSKRRVRKEEIEETTPVISAPVISAPKQVYVSATVTGNFGSFRGKYNSVTKQGSLIILTYPIDSSVFTPPAELHTPIRISSGENNYTVYYPGIEFSLPEYNIGIQVMLQSEDN